MIRGHFGISHDKIRSPATGAPQSRSHNAERVGRRRPSLQHGLALASAFPAACRCDIARQHALTDSRPATGILELSCACAGAPLPSRPSIKHASHDGNPLHMRMSGHKQSKSRCLRARGARPKREAGAAHTQGNSPAWLLPAEPRARGVVPHASLVVDSGQRTASS